MGTGKRRQRQDALFVIADGLPTSPCHPLRWDQQSRGSTSRCADSLTLREFLNVPLHEGTPDHSTLTNSRNRLRYARLVEGHLLVTRAPRNEPPLVIHDSASFPMPTVGNGILDIDTDFGDHLAHSRDQKMFDYCRMKCQS